MERKGLIMGVVALIAVGVIAAVLWNGDDGQTDRAARIAQRDGDDSHRGAGGSGIGSSAGVDHGPLRATSGRAELLGDGGVRRVARVPNPNVERPGPPATNTQGELRRGDEDADRSAGWRLGQTRARMALVDTRVTRLRESVAAAEGRGDAAAAEQQRTVLRRFETRLTELRAEETTLDAQARQDGTIGDVARGMEEGVDPSQATRPPARMP